VSSRFDAGHFICNPTPSVAAVAGAVPTAIRWGGDTSHMQSSDAVATGYWLGSLIDRGQWDSGSARSRGHACMHAADNVTLCLVSKNFKDFSLYRIFRYIYNIKYREKNN